MTALHLLCAFVVLGLAAGAAVPETPEDSVTLVKLQRPVSLKNQRWGGDIFDLYRSSSCVSSVYFLLNLLAIMSLIRRSAFH